MDQPFPKRSILDSSILKQFGDANYIFDENDRKFFKWVEKRRNHLLRAISSFPSLLSKDLYSRHVKNKGLFGKRLIKFVVWNISSEESSHR